MPFADRRLDELLAELQSWLLTLESAPKAPTWSRVLLSEESKVDRSGARSSRPGLRTGDLKTPAEFAPRWQELVDQGLRDWINLSAMGVWKDALVVVAEPPVRGEPHSHTPDRIHVMFSGPSHNGDWTAESRLAIL
jgi:hypothetical protein